MAMEARYVDRIHTRLLARYGSKWINLYAGVEPELVKADWSEQLARVDAKGVRFALEHLPPDFAPNAAQFRALCNRPAANQYVALPAPDVKPQPELVAQIVERVTAKVRSQETPAQRCYENIQRIVRDRGGKMSIAQKRMVEAMQAAGLIEAAV
jgi:hypothetical protein